MKAYEVQEPYLEAVLDIIQSSLVSLYQENVNDFVTEFDEDGLCLGDGLLRFLQQEVSEVADGDFSTRDRWGEAKVAVENAIADLQSLLDAMQKMPKDLARQVASEEAQREIVQGMDAASPSAAPRSKKSGLSL